MKVRLLDICHARSGDKGDAANVGLIAREERYYPLIKKVVTRAVVKRHFKGICFGPVERYELPNLWALNFLLHNTLGGGGTVSLKQDAQGKTLAAALLRLEIEVPIALLRAPTKTSNSVAKKSPAKKLATKKTATKKLAAKKLAEKATPAKKRAAKPAVAKKKAPKKK
jgi:hypothetical protein